jgi:hypothetical protein
MKKILLLLIGVLFTLSVSGQNDPSEINYGAVNTVIPYLWSLSTRKKMEQVQPYSNSILNTTTNL